MYFFQSLPLITYYFQNGPNVYPIQIRNFFEKVALLESLRNDATVYYDYSVQDGETAEIIASKYYSDPGLHWLVILANKILDPQFDWPLEYEAFVEYLDAKYAYLNTQGLNISGADLAREATQAYQLITTSTDSFSGDVTVNTYEIDANTYNNTPQTTTVFINMPDGSECTVVTTTNILSCYDYEVDLNEAKRNIKLIDSNYLNQILAEFSTLVAS